jgi:hypothetical protein
MLVRIPFTPLMCKDTTFLCITQKQVIGAEMNLLSPELRHLSGCPGMSDFSFCFQCQAGSSLVLRRPIEITRLITS